MFKKLNLFFTAGFAISALIYMACAIIFENQGWLTGLGISLFGFMVAISKFKVISTKKEASLSLV